MSDNELEHKENETGKQAPQQESSFAMIINLLCNLVMPFLILKKYSDENTLGPKVGLVVALAFPIFYLIFDWIKKKKVNKLSILCFIGFLIMGGVGLLNLPRQFVAIERASIPVIIAVVLLVSVKVGKEPLVNKLIYNDTILNTKKIDELLEQNGKKEEFEKMMLNVTYLLSATFLLSGIVNYLLTSHYMSDESVTYEAALSQVLLWSFLIIAIPCTIMMMVGMWYMLKNLSKMTGLEMDDLFAESLQDKK